MSSNICTLTALLKYEIRCLYAMEAELLEAFTQLTYSGTDPALTGIFADQSTKIKCHKCRIEELAHALGFVAKGQNCSSIKEIVAENEEVIEHITDIGILDNVLLTAAQTMVKYKISRYKNALYYALQIGFTEASLLLHLTLNEEKEYDWILTQIIFDKIDKTHQQLI